jgi:hypothetical protein
MSVTAQSQTSLPVSEEAIITWSACGPNGMAHWDIAVHHFNPMQCNFGAVVHHVDPAFYERFYDGSTVTPAIRRHMQDWHS